MIVTCPSCEARYRAEAGAVEARGGRVRCAGCGHSWTVEPEVLTLEEAAEPSAGEAAQAAPEPEAAPKPHAMIRQRNEARRRKARLIAEGAGWTGVAAALALMVAGSWLFRADIVALWPRAANAYAAVGAPVNPLGLEVAGLTVTADETAPRRYVIEGVLINVSNREREAAPLRARVLDAEGAVVTDWVVAVESAVIPAGGEARFRTVLEPAPETGREIEVRLDPGAQVREPEAPSRGADEARAVASAA